MRACDLVNILRTSRIFLFFCFLNQPHQRKQGDTVKLGNATCLGSSDWLLRYLTSASCLTRKEEMPSPTKSNPYHVNRHETMCFHSKQRRSASRGDQLSMFWRACGPALSSQSVRTIKQSAVSISVSPGTTFPHRWFEFEFSGRSIAKDCLNKKTILFSIQSSPQLL